MPLADCPECEGTGTQVLRPGTSHDEPDYGPCTNPECYDSSIHLWAVWAPRYIFEGGFGDGWDDNSPVAIAMRQRFFDLRAKERHERFAAIREARKVATP